MWIDLIHLIDFQHLNTPFASQLSGGWACEVREFVALWYPWLDALNCRLDYWKVDSSFRILIDQSLSSSVVTTADGNGHSTMELYEAEWGDFGDPRSPLGCSTASVLSEHTPISGISLDESPPVKALPGEWVCTIVLNSINCNLSYFASSARLSWPIWAKCSVVLGPSFSGLNHSSDRTHMGGQ